MLILNLLGNLGRDAEVKTINDKQFLSFSVASTEKQGETETTTWVSVLCSHNPNLLPFLKKGQQVYVSGRLKAGIYQSNNSFGIDLSVFASTLQLCGGKREERATVSTAGQSSQPTPVATPPFSQTATPASTPFPPTSPVDDSDSSLPF